MVSKIDLLRSIVSNRRPMIVDHFLISPRTASVLVSVYDQLSPPFRKRFLAQRVDQMVQLVKQQQRRR